MDSYFGLKNLSRDSFFRPIKPYSSEAPRSGPIWNNMEKSLVKADRIRERNDCMARFIPREKLSKKARKQLNSEHRVSWMFSPVSRKVESKKAYSRKRKTHDRYDDYGMGFPCITGFSA